MEENKVTCIHCKKDMVRMNYLTIGYDAYDLRSYITVDMSKEPPYWIPRHSILTYVCPECGYIEQRATGPETLRAEYEESIKPKESFMAKYIRTPKGL